MSKVAHQAAASDDAKHPVSFVDLGDQFETAGPAIRRAVDRVLSSRRFILGDEVRACEKALADYCDADHAVGCASGTDALLLALMAVDIRPGDEVITTPYSFFATASQIWRVGARPVFVDIEPDTYNLDSAAVESQITPRTRAVLPVHLYGQCAGMEPLWRLGVRHGIAIIEDAAQAIGADYRGRRAGVLGDIGCFSFYPTKNLGAIGDAGAVTTDDVNLAERMARLRDHGMGTRYHHIEVGINSRLDAIQAAVLSAKLPHLGAWTEARRRNAIAYGHCFEQYGLLDDVQLPVQRDDRRHVFNQYVIRVEEVHRDALKAHLTAAQIGCGVYYPIPLHLQPCFSELGYRQGSLPQAEKAAKETLALPIHSRLTSADVEAVVHSIARYFGRDARKRRSLRGPNYLRRLFARKDPANHDARRNSTRRAVS